MMIKHAAFWSSAFLYDQMQNYAVGPALRGTDLHTRAFHQRIQRPIKAQVMWNQKHETVAH
ncbi:MAG: hypothetical protein CMM77_15105 [Rhodospirillaceae bacterium]|nr:hypothetical protein [Magnetovibrio sp.]MAY68440.1 hypothetical protein [Rhodospirillaceae bacterium]